MALFIFSHLDKESAIQLSRQVDDACLLLSEYNKRLGAELEERKLVGKMLREFISAQKDQLKHTETKLQVDIYTY